MKPPHTLDLVALAVEWGHGRRNGWLSNLHPGALRYREDKPAAEADTIDTVTALAPPTN